MPSSHPGTIKPGYSKLGAGGDTLDIVSAFQSYGGFTAGLINEDQRCDIVRNSCPGPGECNPCYCSQVTPGSDTLRLLVWVHSSCVIGHERCGSVRSAWPRPGQHWRLTCGVETGWMLHSKDQRCNAALLACLPRRVAVLCSTGVCLGLPAVCCHAAGACGGMYTANTMATAIETLGMSLPYSSSTPAEDPLKRVECRLAGRCALLPSDSAEQRGKWFPAGDVRACSCRGPAGMECRLAGRQGDPGAPAGPGSRC